MPIDGGDLVLGLGVVVSLIGAVLNRRAQSRGEERQEKVDHFGAIQAVAQLLEHDNSELRDELKEQRTEIAELRKSLADRRAEHHQCLEEVQAVRMHMLLIARSIPPESVPAELQAYIRSLKEDP